MEHRLCPFFFDVAIGDLVVLFVCMAVSVLASLVCLPEGLAVILYTYCVFVWFVFFCNALFFLLVWQRTTVSRYSL